jgi:hypothetical protein
LGVPRRIKRLAGRYSLVDGIPFQLPVVCKDAPVLMAVFPINAEKARKLLPGNEIHPLRLWNRGLLVVTVIDYRVTSIGKYIEYSIAIACTHGSRPAPRLLPGLFTGLYRAGQYVVDLPVSTEISVKGGKGIWGMPKHQASLNFIIGEDKVSAQYDLDGKLATYVEIARPGSTWIPFRMGAANYCAFRGMLMKSYIYFKGKVGFQIAKPGSARFVVGDHPRVQPLKELEIASKPLATAFIPRATGVLDDYFESWFLSFEKAPESRPEGLESVADLGLGQEWPPPPSARVPP